MGLETYLKSHRSSLLIQVFRVACNKLQSRPDGENPRVLKPIGSAFTDLTVQGLLWLISCDSSRTERTATALAQRGHLVDKVWVSSQTP